MVDKKSRIIQAVLLALMFSIFCCWQYGLRSSGVEQTVSAEALQTDMTDDQLSQKDGEITVPPKPTTNPTPEITESGNELTDVTNAKIEDDTEEEVDEQTYTVTSYEETMTMFASDPVNVRTGPDTGYDSIGALARAQEVIVTGVANTGWYEIQMMEGIAYVSNNYLQEEKPEEIIEAAAAAEGNVPPVVAENQPEAELQPVPDPTPDPAPQQPQPTPQNTAGIIFVGDSRTVQMRAAVGDNPYTWIAENSRGYKWLRDTAISRIDNNVGKGTKIVILLGVNDANHYRDYLELINAKAPVWTAAGATVYFSSCNQVWPNPFTSEEEVAAFNQKMPEGLCGEVRWIDSYSYLEGAGYKLLDGLHFDDATYLTLYSFYLGSI